MFTRNRHGSRPFVTHLNRWQCPSLNILRHYLRKQRAALPEHSGRGRPARQVGLVDRACAFRLAGRPTLRNRDFRRKNKSGLVVSLKIFGLTLLRFFASVSASIASTISAHSMTVSLCPEVIARVTRRFSVRWSARRLLPLQASETRLSAQHHWSATHNRYCR